MIEPDIQEAIRPLVVVALAVVGIMLGFAFVFALKG